MSAPAGRGAIAPAAQRRRGGDSWESFAQALADEAAALAALKREAVELTGILIAGRPEAISTAERRLDAARLSFLRVSAVRRGMQARGFGRMTLREVCGYAPRPVARVLGQRLAELCALATGVRITTANNKSLILAGLDRLVKVTGALQRAASDSPGVYKRRGFVPPPRNSVLVSSKV